MPGDRPCGGVHGLSVLHFGYSRGPQELREELEAENGGVQITSQIRWLRSTEVGASYRERQTRDSPLVVPVLGEVGLHPPLQEWGPASGPLVQGRRVRGGATGRLLQPVLRVEPCWPPVHCRCPQVRPLQGEPPLPTGAPSASRAVRRPVTSARLREVTLHGVAKCGNSGGPHLP